MVAAGLQGLANVRSAEEAANGFGGGAVDDVAGEAAEVLHGCAFAGRIDPAEGGDDDLAGAGEEGGAEDRAEAAGDLGDDFSEGAVDATAESAEGVLDDLWRVATLFAGETDAGGSGDLDGGDGVGSLVAFEQPFLLSGVLAAVADLLFGDLCAFERGCLEEVEDEGANGTTEEAGEQALREGGGGVGHSDLAV